MGKDHIRDYATEAFRFYAMTGGKEQYIKTLMSELEKHKGNGVCSPSEAAVIDKEKIMEIKRAEFEDIEAVDKVLHILDTSCQNEIKKAIEYVYFKNSWVELKKGDIEQRVHYAEINIPASRRQIYRWLKKARILFAEERGLRF